MLRTLIWTALLLTGLLGSVAPTSAASNTASVNVSATVVQYLSVSPESAGFTIPVYGNHDVTGEWSDPSQHVVVGIIGNCDYNLMIYDEYNIRVPAPNGIFYWQAKSGADFIGYRIVVKPDITDPNSSDMYGNEANGFVTMTLTDRLRHQIGITATMYPSITQDGKLAHPGSYAASINIFASPMPHTP